MITPSRTLIISRANKKRPFYLPTCIDTQIDAFSPKNVPCFETRNTGPSFSNFATTPLRVLGHAFYRGLKHRYSVGWNTKHPCFWTRTLRALRHQNAPLPVLSDTKLHPNRLKPQHKCRLNFVLKTILKPPTRISSVGGVSFFTLIEVRNEI